MALGRHIKERTICGSPNFVCFTPQGCEKPVETVQLFCDELEAMRLKHEQGLDIVQWGESMGVSKSTFARIYERAIGKVTDALVHGKIISIQKRCYPKQK